MVEKTPQDPRKEDDQPPTPTDKDCAYFVRDALFPLRRDWGSSGGRGHHSQIHPALMALDRLRTDLIDLRPKSTSYSNLFPRGVLLVPRSEALAGSGGGGSSSSSSSSSNNKNTIEYNGQPEVDEATAGVEVIPDLLTVRCTRCNGNPFLPVSSSAKAFVREKRKPWGDSNDDARKEHELVVCSDRVLQRDYYRTVGRDHSRQDLPVQSMKAVEETLAREIAKLTVNRERETETETETASNHQKQKPPAFYPSFPEPSEKDAEASCEAFARAELLAARAAECLLVRQRDDTRRAVVETRMGSALFPKTLYSVLPGSLQRNFVDRCAYKVAKKHTLAEASEVARKAESTHILRPRDCLRKAWANRHQNSGSQ